MSAEVVERRNSREHYPALPGRVGQDRTKTRFEMKSMETGIIAPDAGELLTLSLSLIHILPFINPAEFELVVQ